MRIASSNRSPRRRGGYVLIMTLVLIAVVALSLSGLARRSLLLANESTVAQRQLQRYWGARSCREFLLERAEEIFEQGEEPYVTGEQPWPAAATLVTSVQLGGMHYHLALSDEDAKLNLNTLTARLRQKRRKMLTQLLGQQSRLALAPDTSANAQRQRRWFRSWGQIVDVSQLGSPGAFAGLMELASSITCWGSGKLNIKRVSDQTLQLLVSKLLDQKTAQELLAARAEATELDWKQLVASLGLRRRDQRKLDAWFTDRSKCYSLWLQLEAGQRQWYYQWVQGDRGSVAGQSLQSFQW